jgi:hypothetical protein
MLAEAKPTGETVQLADVRVPHPGPALEDDLSVEQLPPARRQERFPVPDEPLYFLKAPNAYHPHGAPIVRPKSYDGRIIYEGESGSSSAGNARW